MISEDAETLLQASPKIGENDMKNRTLDKPSTGRGE
jgi:hypothetical protein